MDLGLAGRTALVFGAGGGLGGAIARGLAAEGAAVGLADVDLTAATANADAITAAGGSAYAVAWDLADLASVPERLAEVQERLGAVDVLVNNTGGPPPTPVAGQDEQLWSSSFASMVLPVIKITDAIVPGMRERGWGRVITSTSSGAVAPIPNLGISNTLRASLLTWSKTLAREVGGDGVTCNVVVPGRIATARVASLDQARAEREGRPLDEVVTASTAAIPVGRYAEPDEYGAVVTFLASRQASYVTGSLVRVDGGLIASV
jgi:3-oxoacyl-[acyl-carrier protein] reductase